MTDLEHALRELEIDWPATPDLATAVGARLAAPRRRRLRPRRRWAAALAALVLLVGGTLAIPPARAKVFHWLGITSVEIKVAPIPTVGASLDLGTARPLAAARHVPRPSARPAPSTGRRCPPGPPPSRWSTPARCSCRRSGRASSRSSRRRSPSPAHAQKLDVDGNPRVLDRRRARLRLHDARRPDRLRVPADRRPHAARRAQGRAADPRRGQAQPRPGGRDRALNSVTGPAASSPAARSDAPCAEHGAHSSSGSAVKISSRVGGSMIHASSASSSSS